MDQRDLNDASWWWIGFQFGLGFCLAASIFAAIDSAIGYAIMQHQLRVTMAGFNQDAGQFQGSPLPTPAQAMQNLQNTAQQSIRNLAPPPTLPKPITLAPGAHPDCTAQAHGVYDERYQRCIAEH